MPHPEDSRPPEQDPNGFQEPYEGADLGPYREQHRLRREASRHAQARRVTIAEKFTQTIVYLVGALELLLGLRFLLRLTAANPDNTFASIIYQFSEPFVRPFSTLFISPTFNGSAHIFDVNLLVAMAAYLALLMLVIWFVQILVSE